MIKLDNEDMRSEELKKKVMKDMVVDYSNQLGKNFELAKKVIRITKAGYVEVKYTEHLTGTEKVILYLIGKQYAGLV